MAGVESSVELLRTSASGHLLSALGWGTWQGLGRKTTSERAYSVLGLHLISEIHKTDLELVLELQSLENAVNLLLGLVGKRKKSPLS